MRIFLTGASGFVGSFVLRSLINTTGYQVAVLLREQQTAWRIKDLFPYVRVIEGDLKQLKAIEVSLNAFQPDAVIHLAWDGVMGRDRNAIMQWRNVSQALELVEIAAKVGAKHWIGLGSQAEYGLCQNKIDETTPTRPTTLYGASKFATCLLSERLCQELGIRYVWLRLFSSYGPTDNPDWLIPYLIRTLLSRQKPSLTGAEQLWDYIFIEDVASAVKSVLETDSASGIFNLGSGCSLKLRVIIEKIRDFIDPELALDFGALAYRPDQVMHLEANISRLSGFTDWKPKVDIDTGIKKTVDWYVRRSHED